MRVTAFLLLTVAIAAGPLAARQAGPPERALFDTGDWVLAGGLFGAQLVLMPFDDDVREAVVDMRSGATDGAADALRPLGRTVGLAAVTAAAYGLGRVTSNDRVADVGLHAFAALALGNLVTGSIKVVAGRSRPLVLRADGTWARRGPDEWDFLGGWGSDGMRASYASGHATNAFAIATVLSEELGGATPWIAYPLAAGVAWSRLNDEAHWASDVVMGALVGIASGRLVARHGHRREGWLERTLLARTYLAPSPSLGGLDVGLRAALRSP